MLRSHPVLRDPVSRYRVCLLVFGVLYTLCFCVVMPAHIDESLTYNLATDSSLVRMLSALKDGADGAFPAYVLFAYGWEKLFGSSELSLRLTSGLFVILFVWHCGGHLMRRFGPAAAVVGLLVILANERFIYETMQARFYGLVILLFSIVFWSTWEMTQSRTISGRYRLWHGAACGLLCLSYPLGIVYAGVLALLYSGFSYVRNTFTLATAASFLGGPLLLLTWLPSFLVQRTVVPVFPPGPSVPGWFKYWGYVFLDGEVLYTIVLIGAVLALSARLWKTRRGNPSTAAEAGAPDGETTRGDNTLLVVYAGAFVAVLNVTLALLDAAHVLPVYQMSGVRYGLAAAVAYVVIVARVWEGLEGLIQRACEPQVARAVGRIAWGLVLAGLLAGLTSAWNRWRLEKATMESTLARLSRLAREKHLGIVSQDQSAAFFLTTRAGVTDVKYVLEDSSAYKTLMRRIEKHYPHPTPVTMTEVWQFTNDFVFLPAGGAPVVVHRPGTSAR